MEKNNATTTATLENIVDILGSCSAKLFCLGGNYEVDFTWDVVESCLCIDRNSMRTSMDFNSSFFSLVKKRQPVEIMDGLRCDSTECFSNDPYSETYVAFRICSINSSVAP